MGDGPSGKALVLEASEIFPSRFMEIFASEICPALVLESSEIFSRFMEISAAG